MYSHLAYIISVLAATSSGDSGYEPQNRRKRRSDEMTDSNRAAAQSKSTPAPPRAKRASAAANVKQEPSREQPAKRPIVKQEPQDAVDKEREDAKVSEYDTFTLLKLWKRTLIQL